MNDGANVASLHSGYRGELASDIEERLHPSAFFVDRSNAEGVERLLRLAAERNIRVFWLLPPLSVGLEALRNRSGAEAQFEKWVRSYQSRFPRSVTVVNARKVVSDPAMFIDATHLSGHGAIALSHSLGKALKAELSRPVSQSELAGSCSKPRAMIPTSTSRPRSKTSISPRGTLGLGADSDQSSSVVPGDLLSALTLAKRQVLQT